MARGTRDDDRGRDEPARPTQDDGPARAVSVPMDRLDLPRTEARETLVGRDRTYALRGAESRTLATVGAFRVVPERDLAPRADARETTAKAVRRLADQGLVTRHTVPVNRVPTRVVVLTRTGRDLLDDRTRAREGSRQVYHAGLVKIRELAHDAQLYRLFQAEAARLVDDGATISRVVLDYELKREYQTWLHRPDRPEDADHEVEAFAAAHDLPVIDGHLELPDLRIEYETPDGRLETRDLELVTEHYSRSQLAGKARAGFGCYRAAGGRVGGGSTKAGGRPVDPHLLERL